MRCPARRPARRAAAEETLKLLPSPLEMPRRIGPMASDGAAHSYEDPRLGSSYQYLGRGLSLTIYVYDAGVDAIPDGADNIPVCDQFEDAKNGVAKAGYLDMALKSEQMVRLAPPGDVLLAREARIRIRAPGAQDHLLRVDHRGREEFHQAALQPRCGAAG